MLRVREIMTTDVLTLGPETSIREAMEIFARRHVGGAPVVASGKLVGVVTANDLMACASALPGVPTIRDFVDGFDVEESTIVQDAPDDETGSTFFSDFWEDAGADVVARETTLASPEWNALEEHDVSEAMTRAPLSTLAPESDARLAAAMMRDRRIHRILVTEGDRLVGIVSSLDVAKAVADRKLVDRTYVFNADGARPR